MNYGNLSTTAKCKRLDLQDFLNSHIKVPDLDGKLPHIQEIVKQMLDYNIQIGNTQIVLYQSNAVISNENNKVDIIIPKFQIENKYLDHSTSDGYMKSVFTFEYKNNKNLETNAVIAEEIAVCENSLIISENIIDKNSKTNNKFGLERFLHIFLNKYSIEYASENTRQYKELLKSKIISTTTEKEILGDLVKRMHTSKHVVDSNILLKSAKYADNDKNPFRAKNGLRTLYDLLQDFTYHMKTTDISTHIRKHIKLTNYFKEIANNL